MHDQNDVLESLLVLLTFGQPRLEMLASETMSTPLWDQVTIGWCTASTSSRVPLDIPRIAPFKHGGICMYYNGWYTRKVVEEVPAPNYFDKEYITPEYANAWGDLIKAFFLGITQGKYFKEGIISLLYRAMGLIVPALPLIVLETM
uniref:Uncharacterized protein n=1 Tax=Ananas comosus var. bracteatus TaxID=296719 RepID=A0A6V7P5C6_ANACO|nr:unnamed protein product [Ananas comosus var. bracteatus]